jgi:hypothetical protein
MLRPLLTLLIGGVALFVFWIASVLVALETF